MRLQLLFVSLLSFHYIFFLSLMYHFPMVLNEIAFDPLKLFDPMTPYLPNEIRSLDCTFWNDGLESIGNFPCCSFLFC